MAGELKYDLSGDDGQCLQVILEQNDMIVVSASTVCWMSDLLSVEKLDTFFTSFFGSRTENLRITNLTSQPRFIGLSQRHSGRLLVLNNRETPHSGLYFFKESFVCGHQVSDIVLRPFPDFGHDRNAYMSIPFVFNRMKSLLYCTIPSHGSIFLQSGSEIMTKTLIRGECILINLWSLVAFDESCSVKLLHISQISYQFLGSQSIMVRVEGPGNVYFSSHGSGPRSPNDVISRPYSYSYDYLFNPRRICFNLIVYFVLFYFVLYLVGRYLIDNDLLEELRRQLDQLENNNREDQNGNDYEDPDPFPGNFREL